MRSGHRRRWRHFKDLRGNVVRPTKHKGYRKTEEQKDDHQAQPPVWQFPSRKCSGRHLYNPCRGDDVSGRNLINFTPFCLLEEAVHSEALPLCTIAQNVNSSRRSRRFYALGFTVTLLPFNFAVENLGEG